MLGTVVSLKFNVTVKVNCWKYVTATTFMRLTLLHIRNFLRFMKSNKEYSGLRYRALIKAYIKHILIQCIFTCHLLWFIAIFIKDITQNFFGKRKATRRWYILTPTQRYPGNSFFGYGALKFHPLLWKKIDKPH